MKPRNFIWLGASVLMLGALVICGGSARIEEEDLQSEWKIGMVAESGDIRSVSGQAIRFLPNRRVSFMDAWPHQSMKALSVVWEIDQLGGQDSILLREAATAPAHGKILFALYLHRIGDAKILSDCNGEIRRDCLVIVGY